MDERAGEWAGGWKGGWLETASQHSNVRFALYSTICIAIAVRACTATMHPIHVVFLSGGMKLKQLAFVSSLVMRSVAHTFCSCRISFIHMACVLRCPSASMRGANSYGSRDKLKLQHMYKNCPKNGAAISQIMIQQIATKNEPTSAKHGLAIGQRLAQQVATHMVKHCQPTPANHQMMAQ